MHKKGVFIESEHIVYDMSENILEAKFKLTSFKIEQEQLSVSYLTSKGSKEDLFVPVEIFSSDLAPLEALVKYSRERLKISNITLSKLISRSPASTSNAYVAVKKRKLHVPASSKKYISISIFREGKFSILECVC